MADFPIAVDTGSVQVTRYEPSFLRTMNAYTVAVSLPALTAAGATQDINLPMLEVSANALAGNVINGSQPHVPLPMITASGVGVAGRLYVGAATLPMITVESDSGAAGIITLPALSASGQTLVGQVMAVSVSLPQITIDAVARGDGMLDGSCALPMLTVVSDTLTGGALAASISLKRLVLAASGYTGSVSTAAIELPMFTMIGGAYGEYIGQASIELPMLQLVATAPAGSGLAETVTAFAMNMKSTALTNYDNYAFNSMAVFNGVELMAGSGGIFAVSGNLDEGAIIEAYARLGVTDFGTPKMKRVEAAYLGYRADGELRLKVIVDEHHEYEYQVYPRNYDDIHTNRVKMGKGLKGTYWQAEIGNVDGAGFDLDSLQLLAEPLARKI